MRILNEDDDSSISQVTLYLTKDEAKELYDTVSMILNNSKDSHGHISDKNYEKEITICIYDHHDISSFNERSKKIIETDK